MIDVMVVCAGVMATSLVFTVIPVPAPTVSVRVAAMVPPPVQPDPAVTETPV